jgi:hypothetical protein
VEKHDFHLQERLVNVRNCYESFPHNESIGATVDSLLHYGLVFQDDATSTTSLAGFLAKMLNHDHHADFKLKWGAYAIDIYTCDLILRCLSEMLCITVFVISTRSRIRIFAPSKRSRLHIGLLHAQNSYEETSLFYPLVCSATAPTHPLVTSLPAQRHAPLPLYQPSETLQDGPQLAVAPAGPMYPLASYRDTRRERQDRSLPKEIEINVAIQRLREVW